MYFRLYAIAGKSNQQSLMFQINLICHQKHFFRKHFLHASESRIKIMWYIQNIKANYQ